MKKTIKIEKRDLDEVVSEYKQEKVNLQYLKEELRRIYDKSGYCEEFNKTMEAHGRLEAKIYGMAIAMHYVGIELDELAK